MDAVRFYVRKIGDRWAVGRGDQNFVIFASKDDAIARARDLARRKDGEVVIEDEPSSRSPKAAVRKKRSTK